MLMAKGCGPSCRRSHASHRDGPSCRRSHVCHRFCGGHRSPSRRRRHSGSDYCGKNVPSWRRRSIPVIESMCHRGRSQRLGREDRVDRVLDELD